MKVLLNVNAERVPALRSGIRCRAIQLVECDDGSFDLHVALDDRAAAAMVVPSESEADDAR
jgi:hypothetical protein